MIKHFFTQFSKYCISSYETTPRCVLLLERGNEITLPQLKVEPTTVVLTVAIARSYNLYHNRVNSLLSGEETSLSHTN